MAGPRWTLAMVCSALAALGCRDLNSSEPPDAAPPDGFPVPADDVVPAIGSDATFDLAAWNLQLFPKTPATPALVADLITSMRLDVVVVEEVTSEAAWNELALRLPDHEALLSPHVYSSGDYQKLGVLYRRGLVTVGPLQLLFSGQTGPFPRPPIQVSITVNDGVHAALALDLVGVHLKAGVTVDDRDRRRVAIMDLDAKLRAQVDGGGEDEIVVLGDYNEVVTDAASQAVMAPFYAAPTRYKLQTAAFAQAGGISYLGFGGRDLDHITTTQGLEAELVGAELVVPRLDQQFSGYLSQLSDHLPVVLKIPLR